MGRVCWSHQDSDKHRLVTRVTTADPSRGSGQQACKVDIERFCAVQRGDGRIRECLQDHRSSCRRHARTHCSRLRRNTSAARASRDGGRPDAAGTHRGGRERSSVIGRGRRCGSGRFSDTHDALAGRGGPATASGVIRPTRCRHASAPPLFPPATRAYAPRSE
ncbi:MAG: cysteine rich repeat-containing protein [Burkholderiales bacterium]